MGVTGLQEGVPTKEAACRGKAFYRGRRRSLRLTLTLLNCSVGTAEQGLPELSKVSLSIEFPVAGSQGNKKG